MLVISRIVIFMPTYCKYVRVLARYNEMMSLYIIQLNVHYIKFQKNKSCNWRYLARTEIYYILYIIYHSNRRRKKTYWKQQQETIAQNCETDNAVLEVNMCMTISVDNR